MSLYIKSLLVHVGAIGIIIGVIFVLTTAYKNNPEEIVVYTAATNASQPTPPQIIEEFQPLIVEESAQETATDTEKIAISETYTPPPQPTPPPEEAVEEGEFVQSEITRIQNPYSFPSLSFDVVNTEARSALVNILCLTGTKGIKPITASGVLIDPRGIILTNAHVAQYILLSESPRVHLTCTIRQGAPAHSLWKAEILYIPPAWIEKHAEDIMKDRSTGTGEHDYALLRITKTTDGAPLPASFPALPPDTREAIGFLNDSVLAASYPAEFLSSGSTQFQLYPLSSITRIGELLTFASGTVDLISIGGIASAQGGSSGGAIVNAWGRLIGIITTTSEGATTAERDLRGLTLSYISRDLAQQTESTLEEMLSGDAAAKAAAFNANEAPSLVDLLITQIVEHTN